MVSVTTPLAVLAGTLTLLDIRELEVSIYSGHCNGFGGRYGWGMSVYLAAVD
jgi:hypothetical protein